MNDPGGLAAIEEVDGDDLARAEQKAALVFARLAGAPSKTEAEIARGVAEVRALLASWPDVADDHADRFSGLTSSP